MRHKKIRLSICIPTYNRASVIRECLDSLIAQWREELELIIVDGASTDETPAIVAEYEKRMPAIRCFRRDANVGIDADVLKVVELATGDFCWLMSDDDKFEPGAIDRVMSLLEASPGIAGASLNYVSYDKSLSHQIYTAPASSGGKLRDDVMFDDKDEAFAALGVHLGYLSTQVIDRRLWKNVIAKYPLEDFSRTSWLAVYVIGLMLSERPLWAYVHYKCVGNRSANDSFINRVGGYGRQVIAHVTFDTVISAAVGRGRTRRRVFKGLVADRMPKNLASYKANGASAKLQLQLARLYIQRYWSYPTFWWKVFPIFFVPNRAWAQLRRTYLRFAARDVGNPPSEVRTYTSTT